MWMDSVCYSNEYYCKLKWCRRYDKTDKAFTIINSIKYKIHNKLTPSMT